MNTAAPAATWSCAWLYVRCLRWGIATGAAAGAATGALIGGLSYLGTVAAAFGIGLYGAFFGAIVAVIPSLVGAFVVTEVVRRRHPVALSAADFRADLGIVFAAVAAVVNAGAILATLVYGDAYGLLIILAGDAGGLPVLRWAWTSITNAWADAPAR